MQKMDWRRLLPRGWYEQRDVEVLTLKLILLCHPVFFRSQSMPRFAQMLKSSFVERGHEVQIWSPAGRVFHWFEKSRLAKWAGYVDQYVLFPRWISSRLKAVSNDTLFVFCDQALGPWMPMIANRPHVVHVHDLLALRSALGDCPENPTSLTGRIYQRFIRRGFRTARHFISISQKTRSDLHYFGKVNALTSEVVYNGLNFPYAPLDRGVSHEILRERGLPITSRGMLLHVGGGQWYKNLAGIISLYARYAEEETEPLSLWCVGPPPSAAIEVQLRKVPSSGRVHFFQNLDNLGLQAAYCAANALIFPSLEEGFGWPLVEAQACGCPVITTNAPPMIEVAGEAALYLPRLTRDASIDDWAANGASVLRNLLSESALEMAARSKLGQAWSANFTLRKTIDGYLNIYEDVLARFGSTLAHATATGDRQP